MSITYSKYHMVATSLTGGRCEPMAPVLALVESVRESTDVTVLLQLNVSLRPFVTAAEHITHVYI